jgi:hypothetical protein
MSEQQKEVDKEIKEVIDIFSISCETIDKSIKYMQKYSQLQSTLEDKKKVLTATRILIDHLKSALIDVDYLVNPIENSSMEYTR